jgi:hypothetical protein
MGPLRGRGECRIRCDKRALSARGYGLGRSCRASGHRRLYSQGMLTYDYFSMMKALRAPDKVTSLDPDDWTLVPFPLAFVVFGKTSVGESDD